MTTSISAPEVDRDPLRRMRSYQLASELRRLAWEDAVKLLEHPITVEIAPQLYRAIGSIAASVAEGYSRSSGKDRARIFEYALVSARESLEWYQSALPVLGGEIIRGEKAFW